MPTVQISEKSDKRIEQIQEDVDWNVSKREVADKAIEKYHDHYIGD